MTKEQIISKLKEHTDFDSYNVDENVLLSCAGYGINISKDAFNIMLVFGFGESYFK